MKRQMPITKVRKGTIRSREKERKTSIVTIVGLTIPTIQINVIICILNFVQKERREGQTKLT